MMTLNVQETSETSKVSLVSKYSVIFPDMNLQKTSSESKDGRSRHEKCCFGL